MKKGKTACSSMSKSLIDARFKGNVFFSYGAQIVCICAGFVSVTLMTRYGGIETYGRVAVLTAFTSVITNLLTFRTNEAVVTFYKRGEVEDDLGLCRLSLLAGLFIDLCIGVLLLQIIIFLGPFIASLLLKNSDMTAIVVLFSGVMFVTFLRGTPLGLLVAEERFFLINSLNVFEQGLKVVLLGAMVWLKVAFTLEHIVVVMLISSGLFTCVVYFFPLYRLFRTLRGATVPRNRLSEYARFSLSTFISSSLKAGNQNIDTLILGYLTNPASVGIFNLFRQFLSPLIMLSSPFSAQIYPRFVRAMSENKIEVIKDSILYANQLLIKGCGLLLLVIVPVLIGYDRWNDLHLTIEAYSVFGLMFVSIFIIQQLWWCRPFSLAINPNLSVYAGLLASLVMPISVYFFILLFGFVGVGVGLVLTNFLLLIFWVGKVQGVLNETV